MSASQSIQAILSRVASILHEHQETEWANSFERFADAYEDSPEFIKRQIRATYGGMGSFNDLVLHGQDGIPLQPENDDLDQLRSQLYRECNAS